MAANLPYKEKLESIGHSAEVMALINSAIEKWGVPEHCAECPDNYLEGCELIEAEAFEQMSGEAWKEVIPGMFYRGQWMMTGVADPPMMPHGKGWIMSPGENMGIGAIWANQGKPHGQIISLNQEGEKCVTPMQNGEKNGVEVVHKQDDSSCEIEYKDNLRVDTGKSF